MSERPAERSDLTAGSRSSEAGEPGEQRPERPGAGNMRRSLSGPVRSTKSGEQ